MRAPHRARLRSFIRVSTLVVVAAGPLAIGAVHEPVFIPLLTIASVVGVLSWSRAHWARAHGHPVNKIPGRGWLLGFHCLVVAQLTPLPPGLLRLVSPGSYSWYLGTRGSVTEWRPITVDTILTLRGLAFLIGMTLLFSIAYREFGNPVWRRRLVTAIAVTGAFVTLAGLVQRASLDPGKIYGFWRPQFDYAVFGTYVNKNHYAGLMAMAMPLAIGLLMEAAGRLSRAWKGRRIGWLALGDAEGTAFLRWTGGAIFMLVGVLMSGSRGGLFAAAVAVAAMSLRAGRSRRRLVFVAAVLVALAAAWVDFAPWGAHFKRSFYDSRGKLWVDQSRLVAEFPVFGVGYNALGPIYQHYQTINKENTFAQAHNEYLQILLDTGAIGVVLFVPFFVRSLRTSWRVGGLGPIELGILGAVIGSAASNMLDFNWQIPANAAVFVVLVGAAWRRADAP